MACSVAESYEHCRALARRTAGNFYYSFLTLPRDRRPAMCALYAFMRVTDDLGDSDEPPEVRAAQLANWRAQVIRACDTGLAAAGAGQTIESDDPVLPALADVVGRCG